MLQELWALLFCTGAFGTGAVLHCKETSTCPWHEVHPCHGCGTSNNVHTSCKVESSAGTRAVQVAPHWDHHFEHWRGMFMWSCSLSRQQAAANCCLRLYPLDVAGQQHKGQHIAH